MNKSEPMQAENAPEPRKSITLDEFCEKLKNAGITNLFRPPDKDAIISRQAEQISQMTELLREYSKDHGHQLQRCSICIKTDAILSKESK